MLFKEKQTGLNHHTNRRTILKPWIISGNYVSRHSVQPRVKLSVPKEGSFQEPLKCIGVVSWKKDDNGRVARKAASTTVGTLMVAGIHQGHID